MTRNILLHFFYDDSEENVQMAQRSLIWWKASSTFFLCFSTLAIFFVLSLPLPSYFHANYFGECRIRSYDNCPRLGQRSFPGQTSATLPIIGAKNNDLRCEFEVITLWRSMESLRSEGKRPFDESINSFIRKVNGCSFSSSNVVKFLTSSLISSTSTLSFLHSTAVTHSVT